jgi:hypothetical protein
MDVTDPPPGGKNPERVALRAREEAARREEEPLPPALQESLLAVFRSWKSRRGASPGSRRAADRVG